MSTISNIVHKNDDHFSFLSTFFDLIGNKLFKSAELCTLYGDTLTRDTAFWSSLCAVSEEFGSVFHENVINFIDNICNIDLCKTKQLNSMLSTLGINYTLFKKLQTMPIEIQDFIDIMSIKREYLTSYVKMDKTFIDNNISDLQADESHMSYVSSDCSTLNSARNKYLIENDDYELSSNITYQNYIDDDKLKAYISSTCTLFLEQKITLTYNDKMGTFIYQKLSSEILVSNFVLLNEKLSIINQYKLKYNIDVSFDAEKEVDNIEEGLSSISDYLDTEYMVLSIEIERRKSAYDQAELKTRYKYYREKEVQEYTKFIENNYISNQVLENYLCSNQYGVDNTYVEMVKGDLSNVLFFLNDIGSTTEIKYNRDTIENVSLYITNLIFYIRDIRENLKLQCLKNFIYGTKLFMKFIIGEYIKNNLIPTIKLINCLDLNYEFNSNTVDSDILLYSDGTEYCNIKADNDSYISDIIDVDSENPEFWKSYNNINYALGPLNSNNIFQNLTLESINNISLTIKEISSFYCNILDNRFEIEEYATSADVDYLNDFLITLFKIGADNTFIYNDEILTYDSCIAEKKYRELSTEHKSHIEELTYNYNMLSDSISTANKEKQNIDFSDSLRKQLYSNQIYLENNDDSLLIYNSALSTILESTGEINLFLPLSSFLSTLSLKYDKEDAGAYDEYEYAVANDTFPLKLQLDNAEYSKYVTYDNVNNIYNRISSYIPENYSATDKQLSQLIDELCLMLSSLSSSEERETAVESLSGLSSIFESENILSLKVQIDSAADTISSNYDDKIMQLSNNIDEIRSSDVFNYRSKVFKQYTGNQKFAENPFYNVKNSQRSSFSLHPFVLNFVESYIDLNPIDNLVNDTVDSVKDQLRNHIDQLIDSNGYLSAIHKNPLNSNSDYVSKYEYENNAEFDNSDVEHYDGFCYQPAIKAFFKNRNDFGKKLSKQENEWYLHLDITENDCNFIVEQLAEFGNDLEEVLTGNYDIFRYGLDINQNAYILVKPRISKDDYQDMLNSTSGTLWMRIKDHPIPFPLLSYHKDSNLITITPHECSLICQDNEDNIALFVDLNSSNITVHHITGNPLESSTNWYIDCQDFTFSEDRDTIIINAKKKSSTATCPIIARVNKSFHGIKNRTLYYFCDIGVETMLTYKLLTATLSDYSFLTYYYNDQLIGALYSKISTKAGQTANTTTVTLNAGGAYVDLDNKLAGLIATIQVDELSDQNYVALNACFSTYDNYLDIGYIEDRPGKLSNYIDQEVDFNKLSDIYVNEDYTGFAIKTKQYTIAGNSLIENNSHSYTKYTDIGFYGLSCNENNFDNTYIANNAIDEVGVLKFLLMTDPLTSTELIIDFKPIIIPTRIYENYVKSTSEITSLKGDQFKFNAINLAYAHFFDSISADVLYHQGQLDDAIYSPTLLLSTLYTKGAYDSYQLPSMKLDEDYTKALGGIDNAENIITNVLNSYRYPWLYCSSSKELCDLYIHPCGQTLEKLLENISEIPDGNCQFNIFEEDYNIPDVSVSWYKENSSGLIQLDFNAMYYKDTTNDLYNKNICNNMNMFLNLEQTGEAGILKVYGEPGDSSSLKATLYIKNISDDKPKFLLSANVESSISVTYCNYIADDTDDNLTAFMIEDSDASITSIISETVVAN